MDTHRQKALFHQYVDQLRPVEDQRHTRKLRYLFGRFNILARSAADLGFSHTFQNEDLRIIFKNLLPYSIKLEVTPTQEHQEESMYTFLMAFEESLRKREILDCELAMNDSLRSIYGYSDLWGVAVCVFCGLDDHFSGRCWMTYAERVRTIQAKRLCWCCLKPGHVAKDCIANVRCRHCGRKGHLSHMCPTLARNRSA